MLDFQNKLFYICLVDIVLRRVFYKKMIMEEIKQKNSIDIGTFFKKSGYKILILGILALIMLKKDLAFSINLKSPQRVEQPKNAPSIPKQGNKKESKITKKQPIQSKEGTSSMGGIIAPVPSETSAFQALQKVDKKIREAYIRRFSHVAIDEMRKFKIPASIVLAQGILSSTAGTSVAAKQGNNHFNMTCEEWTGDVVNLSNGYCYRSYISPWRSFRNHSEFITSGKYQLLKNYSTTDYKKWAEGMSKIGFSNQKNYKKQLIDTIEKYQLTRFDQ